MTTDTARFERRVLLLIGLIQFINVWDFMIVMPLGPDFAKSLGIDAGNIGWIAGSYSITAAVSSLIVAKFLDRFDRRSVLIFTICGLSASTFMMITAKTMPQLITVRMMTGMFGGPMFASSLAVIADVFPEKRRGEAMGKVFGAFSVASVVGVPLGLEIARRFGWFAPFVTVSCIALIALVAVRAWLPSMRHHLDNKPAQDAPPIFQTIRRNPAMKAALTMTSAGMFAAFLIIPNISAHVQDNLDYPREYLWLLYLCGGTAAFFSMRFTGRRSDKRGYANTAMWATIGLWVVLFEWFYAQFRFIPVLLSFICFMVTMSTRNVTSNALLSKIPKPYERAGFMSLNSAAQNLMAGVGATVSTLLLKETADHKLAGVQTLAIISMIGFAISLNMMFRIEKALKAKPPQGPVTGPLT